MGLPRASGDLSASREARGLAPWSSPRERGSFCIVCPKLPDKAVFPARAGIFPGTRVTTSTHFGLPRACGDRSTQSVSLLIGEPSSLRAQGSFLLTTPSQDRISVFPACAGVVPNFSPYLEANWGLPRASGDLSKSQETEVGLYSLPRACGDLSRGPWCHQRRKKSSPRQRGSFHRTDSKALLNQVFPARAGIVLEQKQAQKVH